MRAAPGHQTVAFGKQWHPESGTVNEKGQEEPELIAACQQDDALEFKADNTLLYHNGPNKCYTERDIETGVWSLDAGEKVLTMDQVEHQVILLTATRMELRRELVGVSGNVTVKFFYVAQ